MSVQVKIIFFFLFSSSSATYSSIFHLICTQSAKVGTDLPQSVSMLVTLETLVTFLKGAEFGLITHTDGHHDENEGSCNEIVNSQHYSHKGSYCHHYLRNELIVDSVTRTYETESMSAELCVTMNLRINLLT